MLDPGAGLSLFSLAELMTLLSFWSPPLDRHSRRKQEQKWSRKCLDNTGLLFLCLHLSADFNLLIT